MERVKLLFGRRPIGIVRLVDGQVVLDVADQEDRDRLDRVFKETGEVTWAWTRYGEAEWQEHRAEPGTENWLWFVVANILYPQGYRIDAEQKPDN